MVRLVAFYIFPWRMCRPHFRGNRHTITTTAILPIQPSRKADSMKTKLTILVLTILLLLSVSFGQDRTTSTEPLRYVAILSQHGPNAQTANVLYNTLGGTPTFSRMSAGYYAITLPDGFP